MFPADAGTPGLKLRHALAGLQAGVFGALLMLMWFAAASALTRRSVWLIPNLFATLLFGGSAYHDRYVNTSLAGAGFIVLAYGLLGLIWGMIWKENRKPGLVVFGAVAGFVAYYLVSRFLWERLSPPFSVYAPERELMIAHILWGMALAKSPSFAHRIADSTAEPTFHTVSSVSVESPELIR